MESKEIGSESVVYLAGIPCVATLEAVEDAPTGVLRQILEAARELNEEYRAEGLASFAVPDPVPLTRADVEAAHRHAAADYLARKGTEVKPRWTDLERVLKMVEERVKGHALVVKHYEKKGWPSSPRISEKELMENVGGEAQTIANEIRRMMEEE